MQKLGSLLESGDGLASAGDKLLSESLFAKLCHMASLGHSGLIYINHQGPVRF